MEGEQFPYEDMTLGLHTSLLVISYWLKLSQTATSSPKGNQERESLAGWLCAYPKL